ncbi:MAG: shikimate kinase [Saprospiraceae bacterium]
MRIYLIGFMGAGKTSVGQSLAEKLHLEFIDIDAFIKARAHNEIPDIFAQQGEMGFRTWEAECLRLTGQTNHAIIATGGGAPCFFDNMEWINGNGLSIYLKVPANELFRRLSKEREKRPLISGLSDEALNEYIASKLQDRSFFYEQAHLCAEAQRDEMDLVGELADFLGRFLPVK